ncbi:MULTISPECIES: hypothetical protein [Bacillus]|uniref:Uncharacterized protein n=1 Tax=Bacillus pseudomycoides TaxID=64104 RepID=A0AAJ1Z946_9BACI|nr:hypothetical protein [Bacillus pseudomycoides]KFN10658.1 hypothetical protein DJ94_5445 [Bacillus pseudomycoides]MCR8861211.1 hypothetical protein [Bacillus pseudomycoides]MDR4190767.1 hypothetical protein [Bacillus pseudomycoides]MDR4329737.1 hypothetical protein [Bacillus pseudomycoides]MED0857505.1 hypothetical protein [Bacillus pseudomycoides]
MKKLKKLVATLGITAALATGFTVATPAQKASAAETWNYFYWDTGSSGSERTITNVIGGSNISVYAGDYWDKVNINSGAVQGGWQDASMLRITLCQVGGSCTTRYGSDSGVWTNVKRGDYKIFMYDSWANYSFNGRGSYRVY